MTMISLHFIKGIRLNSQPLFLSFWMMPYVITAREDQKQAPRALTFPGRRNRSCAARAPVWSGVAYFPAFLSHREYVASLTFVPWRKAMSPRAPRSANNSDKPSDLPSSSSLPLPHLLVAPPHLRSGNSWRFTNDTLEESDTFPVMLWKRDLEEGGGASTAADAAWMLRMREPIRASRSWCS